MPRRPTLALAAALTLGTALTAGLTGCGGTVSPAASGSTSPSASQTPSPDPTIAPAVLPSDCGEVGTAATRADTVDRMDLQGDGAGFDRSAPEGAVLKLGCDWMMGDVTGYLLLISTADPTASDEAVGLLTQDGFACTSDDTTGTLCTKAVQRDYSGNPFEVSTSVVSRGDVWIYLESSNIDGEDLLADLTAQIWAS